MRCCPSDFTDTKVLQVNFSDALPFPKRIFEEGVLSARVTVAEDLLITGMPRTEPGKDAENFLEKLVEDGGVRMSACPTFVKVGKDLRPLSGFGITSTWIRYDKSRKLKGQKTRNTAWKYVWRRVDSTERKLVEFDYQTGKALDDLLDNLSDVDENDSDEDGHSDEDSELGSSAMGSGFDPERDGWSDGGYEPPCANCRRGEHW